MKTSILIPSLNRPEGLKRAIESALATTEGFDVEIVIVLDEHLESLRDTVWKYLPNHFSRLPILMESGEQILLREGKFVLEFNHKRIGGLQAWNEASRLCTGDMIFCFGDDGYCHPDWLKNALQTHQEKLGGFGCIGINDLHHKDGQFVTTFLYDRRFVVEYLGGVVACPRYCYYHVDSEIWERSKASGKFIYEPNSIVEHMHPAAGKREADETDRSHDPCWQHDQDMFNQRKSQGFPDDFEPIVKMLDSIS